jgi:GNAT superfamily N-acetyltransferase
MAAPVSYEPFGQQHFAGAAEIAAARTARLRARVPVVPDQWAAPATWGNVLASVAERGVGRAAVQGGRVVGVLAGWPVRSGQPRVYCPEATAGAAPDLEPREARRIVEGLAEAAQRDWVADGIRSHFVSVIADDATLFDTLAWLGFGVAVVDALAPVGSLPRGRPADEGVPGIAIRRAGLADLDAVLALEAGLRRHLVDSPTYLVIGRPIDAAEWTASLGDDEFATLLAEDLGGAALAFLRIGRTADDVAQVVRDEATTSISRAFTLADRRGTGIARALLAGAAAWARDRGAVRVGVDFESANVLASRFWTAHFTPVVLSVNRHLHPLAGTAEAEG